MSERTDDDGEHLSNLYQRINALEGQVSKMTLPRSEGGLNELSLRVATLIEDVLIQSHESRSQRLAKMQIIVREAIREALIGERKWNAWTPHVQAFSPQPETTP